MPLVGWLLTLLGASAIYAAYKGERLSDVIGHAVNPKLQSGPSLSSAGTESPPVATGGPTVSVNPSSYVSNGGAAPAIQYAQQQLGKPYRWAAAGPNAFDCSGLTMMAYRAAGKILPHFSQAQYVLTAPYSLPIGAGFNFPPGTLVFFGSSKATIDHVGIVTGDDQMIEAPHTGDVVKFHSISGEGLPLVAATNWLGTVKA